MIEPTVANLILALQKLPQDAIVELRDDYSGCSPVDLDYLAVFDFTEDKYKGKEWYGKVFVELEVKG